MILWYIGLGIGLYYLIYFFVYEFLDFLRIERICRKLWVFGGDEDFWG